MGSLRIEGVSEHVTRDPALLVGGEKVAVAVQDQPHGRGSEGGGGVAGKRQGSSAVRRHVA